MRLAARIHNTSFVPKALRGDPNSVLACILTGDELGLGPMQSLAMINVIEGKPAISAELMRALVHRAGHEIKPVGKPTSNAVTLKGRRRGETEWTVVTWEVADAKRAGLLPAKPEAAWTKYPRSMLLARATSELCRQVFSDVIGGLYTPEETAAIDRHVYELSPDEVRELVDPLTDIVMDPEDELDAAWQTEAGVDPETGELCDTPGAT